MSPAVDIEEMKPAIHMVANFARSEQPGIPADAWPGYADFLCKIFDRLKAAEDHFLEHGPRSRQLADKFRATYSEWLSGAEIVASRTPWHLTGPELRDGLNTRIMATKEALADFAIGEAGEKRLAGLFRGEGV